MKGYCSHAIIINHSTHCKSFEVMSINFLFVIYHAMLRLNGLSLLSIYIFPKKLSVSDSHPLKGSIIGPLSLQVAFTNQWRRDLFRCRIDLFNFSMGFNIIAPYMEFLHLNWYIAEWNAWNGYKSLKGMIPFLLLSGVFWDSKFYKNHNSSLTLPLSYQRIEDGFFRKEWFYWFVTLPSLLSWSGLFNRLEQGG